MVKDCIISCYNHPTQGDYNIEALIFNMAAARFLDVFEVETKKIKENAITLIITCLGDYSTIFTSPLVNNNLLLNSFVV